MRLLTVWNWHRAWSEVRNNDYWFFVLWGPSWDWDDGYDINVAFLLFPSLSVEGELIPSALAIRLQIWPDRKGGWDLRWEVRSSIGLIAERRAGIW